MPSEQELDAGSIGDAYYTEHSRSPCFEPRLALPVDAILQH